MPSSVLRTRALLVLPLALVLTACDMSLGHLTGRASEEWTRSYPLAAGGQVRIGNTNGRIEVEGIDGSTVEVRAEKIARAATDDGAKELLPRITIKEDIQPSLVSIETDRLGGMGGIMGMLPGIGKIKKQLGEANIDEGMIKRQEAIISSMTKAERKNPKLLNASRRIRIANGSGTSVQEINRLLKQYQDMSHMMKKMSKLGKKGLMRHGLGALMPGGGGGFRG